MYGINLYIFLLYFVLPYNHIHIGPSRKINGEQKLHNARENETSLHP